MLSGLTTPSSGSYNVTLDSSSQESFDARAPFTSSEPTILFYRTGLDSSVLHVLEIVNVGNMDEAEQSNDQGTLLVVGPVNVTSAENPSYVLFFTFAISLRPPSANKTHVHFAFHVSATWINIHSNFLCARFAAANSSLPSHHRLTRGAVAGIVVGTILAVLLLLALSYIVWRWRRREARRKRNMIINPQLARKGRLSFLFSHRPEDALESFEKEQSVKSEPAGVLHISRGKSFDLADEDEHDDLDGVRVGQRIEKGKAQATTQQQPSPNSDGSFSIDLPDLPPAHLSRSRTQLPGTSQQPIQLVTQQSATSPAWVDPASPRSPKPRGPREMHGRDGSRGILLPQLPSKDLQAEEGALSPHYLPAPAISPLRVEFAHEQKPERSDRPERTVVDEDRHLSVGALSLPRSHALAHNVDPENPSTTGARVTSPIDQGISSDSGYSFLDLSSSPNLSSLSGSNSKRSSQSGPTSSSDQSARDAAYASLDRRPSMVLSMTMGPGRTSSRPSVTTTNISLQPVTISPPLPVPTPPLPTDIPRYSHHPHADLGMLPSPTDSIPLTVSDIHFRHSVQSTVSSSASQSRRASALRMSGSHRVPHPPLPGLGQASSQAQAQSTSPPATPGAAAQSHERQGSQDTRPFIVQKILGVHNAGSVPMTPYEGSPISRMWPPGSAGGPGSASGTPSSSPAPGTSTFGFGLGRR